MFGLFKRAAMLWPALRASMTALMLASFIPTGHAALTLNGTRVVFDSDKRSTSMIVVNPTDRTFAVQTWVNTAADDATTAVPFIPTPPLFRLNPGKEQQVQINGLPNTLPTDRESLFYFNVQEIPEANAQDSNVLNIALRTRIKLFYRPAQLKDNPVSRLKDLQWSFRDINGKPHLEVNNPTPFHVSFIQLHVIDQGKKQVVEDVEMVAPMSRRAYPLKGVKPGPGLQVELSAINDYGGYTAPLTLPIKMAP